MSYFDITYNIVSEAVQQVAAFRLSASYKAIRPIQKKSTSNRKLKEK